MGKLYKTIQENTIKVYFVRHGETDYNLKEIRQGQLDIPLNKNGEEQAKRTAEILSQEIKDESPEKICLISSDLKMAKNTANRIKKELNLPKIITSKVFRETNFGTAQGKSKESLKSYNEYSNYNHPKYWNFKYKGKDSETREEVANRFNKGFKKYTQNHSDKKIIIFVAHSDCIKNFLEKHVYDDEVEKLENCEFNYLEVCNLKTK